MGFEKFAAARESDFQELQEISRQSGGRVSKVRFRFDQRLYVLKQVRLSAHSGSQEQGRASSGQEWAGARRRALNEVTLLQQLEHPNVVRFFGHFWDEQQRSLFMVLEYCECGDLGRLIAQRRREDSPLQEAYIWRLFHQICLGVQHLHQNGIVHRDLKALNILLVNNGRTAKVADLGVSRQVEEQESLLKTFIGTPLYLSPELVDGSHYTEKTDIWSLGVLLYELCMLTPPFRANSISGLGQCIKDGQYPPLSAQYSPSLSRVISSLLQQDYRKRPNISQLVERVEHHMKPENSIEKKETIVDPSPREPPQEQQPKISEVEKNKAKEIQRSQSQAKLKPNSSSSQLNIDPIDKSAYHVRRSIMDEGNLREYQHSQSEDQKQKTPQSHIAADENFKHSELDSSAPNGMVYVDVNRISVHERREKNILRKLLQAKGLMTSEIVSEGLSGNNSGRSSSQGTRDGVAAPHAEELSASLVLEERIQRSKELIALLEEAILTGGLITPENAAKCNLPLTTKLKETPLSQQDNHMNRDNGISPIRQRAWPLSCQERARQETPPEIQIKYAGDDSEYQREMFQENKHSKHGKHFSVFGDQPVERPTSHQQNRSNSSSGNSSAQSRPHSAAPTSRQLQQRQERLQHQQDYFLQQRQQQQQHPHQNQFFQPSSGSASRHVHNSKRAQQRPPHINHNDKSNILSHREDSYGWDGKNLHGRGGSTNSTPMNSRQFHRVSHLSPSHHSTEKGSSKGKGSFNIISGQFDPA